MNWGLSEEGYERVFALIEANRIVPENMRLKIIKEEQSQLANARPNLIDRIDILTTKNSGSDWCDQKSHPMCLGNKSLIIVSELLRCMGHNSHSSKQHN